MPGRLPDTPDEPVRCPSLPLQSDRAGAEDAQVAPLPRLLPLLLLSAALMGPPAGLTAVPAAAVPVASRPLAGARFWVDPGSAAALAARAATDPAARGRLQRIAGQPQAVWLGDEAASPGATVAQVQAAAARAARTPVFTLYALPDRDCGGQSAGGLSPAGYLAWVRDVARGIGGRPPVVVLEPDALAQLPCLPADAQATRLALLRDAVTVLTRAGALVYLDAGHAGWVPPATMAARLAAAGVDRARGVALNVSSFATTRASVQYAHSLAVRLPGLHAVIDTSRNGAGPAADEAWCNPPGRALGPVPRPALDPVVDALLWIKRPGESDGSCGRGEPPAGTFWPAYAEQLAGHGA